MALIIPLGDALVFPDFQDEYGQGLDGTFTHFRGTDGKIYTWAAGTGWKYTRHAEDQRRPRPFYTRRAGEPKWKASNTKTNGEMC